MNKVDTNGLRMMGVASKRLTAQSTGNIEESVRAGSKLTAGIAKAAVSANTNEDRVILGTLGLMSGRLSERSSESIADRVRRGAELSNAIRQAM